MTPGVESASVLDSIPIHHCTVSNVLRRAAALFRDLPAVIAPQHGARWSFAELDARADAIAAACIAAGFQKGDRAVVYSFNLPEWVALQYGLARAGVVLVTANTALKHGELTYILKKSGARALFFSPPTPSNDLPGVVGALERSALPALRCLVGLKGARAADSIAWDDFLSRGDSRRGDVAAAESAQHVTDLINMQYTSGTTGFPKGVMLSHTNLVENAAAIAPILGYRPGDKLCLAVPLFHCFGCVIGTLTSHNSGVAMILNDVFNADAVLDVVEKERATAIYGVPTMFVAELEALRKRPRDLKSLRVGVMAGAACPEALMREVHASFPLPGLVIAYGLTEASPGVTLSAPSDSIDLRATTIGPVLPGVEAMIVDPATGERVQNGVSGELWTRGPNIMLGYDGEEAATRAALTSDGWLRTGDLGVRRDDGYFRIVGRIKELIIRGGENISPAEVEDALRRHPAVLDAAVFGMPSAFFGEEVAAAIRLKPGGSTTEPELRSHVESRLACHKVPSRILFVEAFPLTGSGKIQRFKLRDLL